MRRRIVLLTAGVAAVAVLLLGVPLVVLGRNAARNDAKARVDREADTIAFALAETLDTGGRVAPTALAQFAGNDRYVVVRDATGNITRVGNRPRGVVITGRVTRNGATITVRAEARRAGDRANEITLAVIVLGGVAVIGAALVALVAARRVTAPLDELADASARLGAGDFSVTLPRHGITETDALADALETSAARIDDLVRAEREFSANASHQLRSPLTALRMRLEELRDHGAPGFTRAEAEAALEQADRLDATITELLALARSGRAGDAVDVDLSKLLAERQNTWRSAFAREHRALAVNCAEGTLVRAHPGAIGHAFDAVLDNALRHGRGRVDVTIRRRPGDTEVVVRDEGTGVPDAIASTAFDRHVSTSGGTGVGLALARTLVEADGGRLDLVGGAPTTFRFRFPPVPQP